MSTSSASQTIKVNTELKIEAATSAGQTQGKLSFVDNTDRSFGSFRVFGQWPFARLVLDSNNLSSGIAFRTATRQGNDDGGSGEKYSLQVTTAGINATNVLISPPTRHPVFARELGYPLLEVGRAGTQDSTSLYNTISKTTQNSFRSGEIMLSRFGTDFYQSLAMGFQSVDGSLTSTENMAFFSYLIDPYTTPTKHLIFKPSGEIEIPLSLKVGTITADNYVGLPVFDPLPLTLDTVNNRIGINQVTPTEALDVVGNAKVSGTMTADTVSATTYIGLPPVVVPASELLPITLDKVNNRVGINNTNPTNALDITGNLSLTGRMATTSTSISIGSNAGSSLSTDCVAIGNAAGQTTQGSYSVAIGGAAGQTSQGQASVALGYLAGQSTQGTNSIAIGNGAGYISQGQASVAVGNNAGTTTQAASSVAIGNGAGYISQGQASVAVGNNAGTLTQAASSVAIGNGAGYNSQANNSVAIGLSAGNNTQSVNSVAIGVNCGQTTQGSSCVAIGNNAGNSSQGNTSIAIGQSAGQTNQHANSIILNATGSALNSDGTSRTYVAPLREAANDKTVQYNTTTKEVTYTDTLVTTGTGSPEGAITAPVGRLFLRTNGDAETTMYVKISGTGNTGWAPVRTNSTPPSWSIVRGITGMTPVPFGTITGYTDDIVPPNQCTVNKAAGTVTITVPGRYYISFFGFTMGDVNQYAQVSVMINNVFVNRNYAYIAGWHNMNNSVGGIYDLNVNDVVTISWTGTAPFYPENNCTFSGYMIR